MVCIGTILISILKKDAKYDQTTFSKALGIDPRHVTSPFELDKSYLLQDNC